MITLKYNGISAPYLADDFILGEHVELISITDGGLNYKDYTLEKAKRLCATVRIKRKNKKLTENVDLCCFDFVPKKHIKNWLVGPSFN